MPSDQIAITARGLAKSYRLFDRGHHRLLQSMPLGFGQRFYRDHWALQEMDLEVRRGESFAVIGRNGSGKSTFLQLLCGTTSPTRGWIETTGRIAPLLELGAGFAPEFTGRENVRLAASILGIGRREIQERLDRIIEFADLPDGFIDQPVKRYSSGMYARLAFSVAINVDADILVVDEILAVGDGAFVQKCMREIRRFKEHGTLFFVSHDTAAVLSLCNQAIWLDKGRLMKTGASKDVVLEYEASLKQREAGSTGGFEVSSRQADGPVDDSRAASFHSMATADEALKPLFDPKSACFGEGGAEIDSVRFLDESDQPLELINGGEIVSLEVTGSVSRSIAEPIVGFYVQDRLGQVLFADNTSLSLGENASPINSGDRFRAAFRFQMPWLPVGEYSVGAAIADGPRDESVPRHWIESAMTFRIHGSHVSLGLVGLPMLSITLDTSNVSSAPAEQS